MILSDFFLADKELIKKLRSLNYIRDINFSGIKRKLVFSSVSGDNIYRENSLMSHKDLKYNDIFLPVLICDAEIGEILKLYNSQKDVLKNDEISVWNDSFWDLVCYNEESKKAMLIPSCNVQNYYFLFGSSEVQKLLCNENNKSSNALFTKIKRNLVGHCLGDVINSIYFGNLLKSMEGFAIKEDYERFLRLFLKKYENLPINNIPEIYALNIKRNAKVLMNVKKVKNSEIIPVEHIVYGVGELSRIFTGRKLHTNVPINIEVPELFEYYDIILNKKFYYIGNRRWLSVNDMPHSSGSEEYIKYVRREMRDSVLNYDRDCDYLKRQFQNMHGQLLTRSSGKGINVPITDISDRGNKTLSDSNINKADIKSAENKSVENKAGNIKTEKIDYIADILASPLPEFDFDDDFNDEKYQTGFKDSVGYPAPARNIWSVKKRFENHIEILSRLNGFIDDEQISHELDNICGMLDKIENLQRIEDDKIKKGIVFLTDRLIPLLETICIYGDMLEDCTVTDIREYLTEIREAVAGFTVSLRQYLDARYNETDSVIETEINSLIEMIGEEGIVCSDAIQEYFEHGWDSDD